jgi:hypothetical protein
MSIIITQNKISFDFDGTLHDDFDGTVNPQKEEIQSICKELINQGKDVCIITKRYHPSVYSGESEVVVELAKELGVKKIYFTNRVLKDQQIKELGIECHFENSEFEANVIKANNPNTLVIHIENTSWKKLVYNQ